MKTIMIRAAVFFCSALALAQLALVPSPGHAGDSYSDGFSIGRAQGVNQGQQSSVSEAKSTTPAPVEESSGDSGGGC